MGVGFSRAEPVQKVRHRSAGFRLVAERGGPRPRRRCARGRPVGPEVYAETLADLVGGRRHQVRSRRSCRHPPGHTGPPGGGTTDWIWTSMRCLARPGWQRSRSASAPDSLAAPVHPSWGTPTVGQRTSAGRDNQLHAYSIAIATAQPEPIIAGAAAYMFAATTFEIKGSAPAARRRGHGALSRRV